MYIKFDVRFSSGIQPQIYLFIVIGCLNLLEASKRHITP